MTLEELQDMWTVDAKIDITEPSKEMARIPILHAKYCRELNSHFMLSKELTVKLKKLHYFKREYYKGNLNNPEDLKKYNLEPFQENLSDIKIGKLLDTDQDILDLNLSIDRHIQAYEFCKFIVKQLSDRTFQISKIIEHEKWIGGN